MRTTFEWRTHPRDVLALWVAGMVIEHAPDDVDALSEALRLDDTGYAARQSMLTVCTEPRTMPLSATTGDSS